MSMNLAALETFYWIVRLGTFHAAATRLNISQPAVSARIRELETSLGLELFDRVGRSVRPTPQGRKVYDCAGRILGEVDNLLHQTGASLAVSGIVRIGVGELLTRLWLPDMLQELQRRYQDLRFDVEVDVSVNLQRALLQGDIDIAFLARPIQGPELEVFPLMNMEMCWVAGASLIAPGKQVTAAELAQLPVLTLSRVSSLHAQTANWFASQCFQPRRMHVCNSVALLSRLVALGLGIAILPRMLVTSNSGLYWIDQPIPLADLGLVSALHSRNSGRPAEIVNQLAIEFAERWATNK